MRAAFLCHALLVAARIVLVFLTSSAILFRCSSNPGNAGFRLAPGRASSTLSSGLD